MASDNFSSPEQIDFLSKLIMQLEIMGVPDVQAAFNEICKLEKKAISNAKKLVDTYGSLEKAAENLARVYKDRAKLSDSSDKSELNNKQKLAKVTESTAAKIEKSDKKHYLSNQKFIRQYGEIANRLKGYGDEIAKGVQDMVAPSSLGKSITVMMDYNKSMLSASVGVSRLGIGLISLQSNLERVAAETTLTRQETLQLFDKFQEGMKFVSLTQFENILKRIKNIVGANSEEMGKMQGAIASLSQEYPGLANSLANIEQLSGSMAESEKNALKERVRSLYLIGKIGDAQYRQVTAYITGSQLVSREDQKRQKEIQNQIDAVNQFKRTWESTTMSLGKAILPLLPKIAGLLKSLIDFTEKWNISLLKIGVAFGAFKLLKGALGTSGGGMGGGGLANAAGGKLLGKVGASLGKKGGIIGIAGKAMSGVSGSMVDGTRVFVTNWPGGLGGGGGAGGSIADKVVDAIGNKTGGMMGNLKGKAGGLLKGKYGGSMKMGLGGLAALGVSAVSDFAGSKFEEQGYKKTGAALKGVSGAAGIVGSGLTGASIGSAIGTAIFPVVGTAIGAALGGLGGVALGAWQNKEGLANAYMNLTGEGTESNKPSSLIEDIISRSKKENEIKSLQDRTGDAQTQVMKDIGAGKLSEVLEDLSKKLSSAQASYDEERRSVDARIVKKFKAQGLADMDESLPAGENVQNAITKQKGAVDTIKGAISEREAKGIETTDADKKILDDAEKKLQKMIEITEQIEEGNSNLKRTSEELKVQESRYNAINDLMSKQEAYMQSINALSQSQGEYLSALIEKMSRIGKVDNSKILEAADVQIQSIEERAKAAEDLMRIMKMTDKQAAQRELDSAIANSKEGSARRKELEETKKTGILYADKVVTEQKMVDLQTIVTNKVSDQSKVLEGLTRSYDGIVKLSQTNATQAGLLVQLADNYAIGVGASAEMRRQEFRAQGDVIKELKKKLELDKLAYERSIALNLGEEENVRTKNQMVQTQNEITQAQIQQAASVKSMRDGWVSAISAMSTGMDGFSEIMMNAEENTAQIQMLDGAVKSSVSGAYALRDSFGNVMEDFGFQASEAMNQFGQIAGRGGRRLGEASYLTESEKRSGLSMATGGYRETMEAAQRGEIMPMITRMAADSERVADGVMTALAAAGNKNTLSVQAGMVDSSSSPINLVLDNITIKIDKINGIEDLAVKLKDRAKEAFMNSVSSALGDFAVPTNTAF